MQKLTFGFSPCPNDTFIFDALYNKKIDWQGLDFEFVLGDVEYLNQLAFDNKIDITKISYYSFAQLADRYQMMRSGGALGFNCGPLLVSKGPVDMSEPETLKVAIPGKNTTANLLCTLAYPELKNKEEVIFSEIENGVLNGNYDLGLIIHESRFTYGVKRLTKIADLGEYWEETTHSPIPLGGICISRDLDHKIQLKVEQLIRESVEYAFENRTLTMPFIEQHAQEMDPQVMNAHIDLYVNEFSIDLGEQGMSGVNYFLNYLQERDIIPPVKKAVFV
jgi:1,4-dihydroxy-6-naphthoate synthase